MVPPVAPLAMQPVGRALQGVQPLSYMKTTDNPPSQRSDPASKYLPELDGVRAFSVLAVLALHVSYGRFSGGFLGVDVFFVLSGFLITALLMGEIRRTKTVSLRSFYLRRAFRILPPIFGVLLVAAILWHVPQVQPDFAKAAAAVLFFGSNFVPPEEMGMLSHTWSLAIEEQFYVVWPFIIALSSRRVKVLPNIVALVGIAGSLLFRYWHLYHGGDPLLLYPASLARMDSLLVGCLIALNRRWIFHFTEKLNLAVPLYLVAFCMLVMMTCTARPFALRTFWFPTVFATICGVFFILLLSVNESHFIRRLLRQPFLRQIGVMSFGIYVYHQPVFSAFERFRILGDAFNVAWVAVAKILGTLILAVISYYLVEKPLLRLRPKGKCPG